MPGWCVQLVRAPAAGAEARDIEFDDVTGSETRGAGEPERDARWGTGVHDVAGTEHMDRLRYQTMCSTLKFMSLVDDYPRGSPFTQSCICRAWGSGIDCSGASHGPRGVEGLA